MNQNDEQLRYPIGRLEYDPSDFSEKKAARIATIADAPQKFRALAEALTEEQLNSPYRPGGWTGKQVIHHVADSHMNAYIRFKWALTEKSPTIKAYEEGEWAKLVDYSETPLEVSLGLLEHLHKRWVILLENMTDEQWTMDVKHPEWEKSLSNQFLLAMYDWHSRHHLGHLELLQAQ